jgi:hypothetical protein
MSGITVITMTGNVYTVASGASAETSAASATGQLCATVYGPETQDGAEDGPWLASFTNAEAVYLTSAVEVATAPAEEETAPAKPKPWA